MTIELVIPSAQSHQIKQGNFVYFFLGNEFKSQIKTIGNQVKRQFETFKDKLTILKS